MTLFTRELTGRSCQIDKLTAGLSDYNDIFYLLCAMDPRASRIMETGALLVRQLLKGEIDSNSSLRSLYNQLGEVTEKLEEAERLEQEKKRRYASQLKGRTIIVVWILFHLD